MSGPRDDDKPIDRPDPVGDALRRPSQEEGRMHFGAKPEESAPDGSADDAVKRAAAGWSGRAEDERAADDAADADAMSRGSDEA